jgi:hypothetical protein
MDQTQLQQKIAECYQKLPPEAQKVFADMQWMDTVQTIGATFSLSQDQIATLATETTLALLGIIDLTEYEGALTKNLNAPEDTVIQIITEVIEKVLEPISPSLGEAFEKNTQEQRELSEVPPPPYAPKEEPILPIDMKEITPAVDIEIPSIPSTEKAKPNIITEKLSGITKSSHVVADYTLPKMRPQGSVAEDVVPTPPDNLPIGSPLTSHPHDPYQEPI